MDNTLPPPPPPPPPSSAAFPTAVPFASSPPPPPPPQESLSVKHPPYAEMIMAAVASLKEKDGSSRTAIGKYIAQHYTNLPPKHKSLLGTYLRRLKENGTLVTVKKSYKLSSDVNRNNGSGVLNSARRSGGLGSASGSKRPSGRAPKAKAGTGADADAAAAQAAAMPMFAALGLVDEPKRKPGRPKKNQGGAGSSASVAVSSEKRRPGRPPRDKSVGKEKPKSAVSGSVERPKKAHVPVMIPYAPEALVSGANAVNLPNVTGEVGGAVVAVSNSGVGSFDVGAVPSASGGFASGAVSAPGGGVASGSVSLPNDGVSNIGTGSVPRKRGRPRKEDAVSGARVGDGVHDVGSSGVSKKRGRPRKYSAGNGVQNGLRAGIRLGAAAGIGSASEFGVGTSNASVVGVSSGTMDGAVKKRGRGRPPKLAQATVVPTNNVSLPGANGTTEKPGKQRGRQPRVAEVQKQQKGPGKPMGRPRKSASTDGNSQAATRDLMRKLDYFQTKIKEAVLKLRPHISGQVSREAVAAMQELEGLAALDVNAPFGEAAQQPRAGHD